MKINNMGEDKSAHDLANELQDLDGSFQTIKKVKQIDIESFKSRASPPGNNFISPDRAGLNLRIKRSCRTENVSRVPEEFQDMGVIEESSSSWDNESDNNSQQVSSR